FAVVAAAPDASRAALLLAAAHAIGKRVVGGDVVHLRGGLVVPRAPRFAAVEGDDRSLIAGDENGLGIVGIDPDVLIVVAPRRAAKARPRLAAIYGLPGDGR